MSTLIRLPVIPPASNDLGWRPLPATTQARLAARVAARLAAQVGTALPPGPGGWVEIARDIDRLVRLARQWRCDGAPGSLAALKQATCGRCSRRREVAPCPVASRGWCVLRDAAPGVAAALDHVLSEEDGSRGPKPQP